MDPILTVLPAGLHGLGLELPTEIAELGLPPPIIADNFASTTPRDLVSVATPEDAIDAQVRIAFTVARGSGAAVVADGHRFGDIRKKDDSAVDEIKTEARRILQRLVDNRDVRITKISVADVATDALELSVDYLNLRAPASNQKRNFTRTI